MAMSSLNVPKRSYGVDLAIYQSSTVNYSGAKFALVKLTEGTGYINPKAEAQIKSAKANGIMPMGYFFALHSANATQAKAEAEFAIKKAKEFGLPAGSYIADDWETGDGNRVDGPKSGNTDAVMTAMSVIKSAGYKPLIYSGASNLRNHLDTNRIVKLFGDCIWVAAYPLPGAVSTSDFRYFPSMDGVAIWQFTDNWKGYNVDGNISLVDLKVSSDKPAGTPKDLSLHPVVKWNVGGVAVVANGNRAYVYTSSKLDKRQSDKLKPQGSEWEILALENGAVKVGKDQYFDGRAVYIKLNPIAYSNSKHAVAKIVMPNTHALYEPKADSAKAYAFKLNDRVEIVGRSGRFLKLKDSYKGKTVYVTGNRAYIVL